MKTLKNTQKESHKSNDWLDRFAAIGKLTIGALTGLAIIFLIHQSNH